MSTHNYLDKTGLGQVWGKIKDLIPESDIFLVTITSTTSEGVTTYSANKTIAEVESAYNSGKYIYLLNSDNNFIYNLILNNSNSFIFNRNNFNQVSRFLWTKSNGRFIYSETNLSPSLTFDSVPTDDSTNPVTSNGIFEAINYVKPYYVEITDDMESEEEFAYLSDKTYSEIDSINDDGIPIYFQYGDYQGKAIKNYDGNFYAMCFDYMETTDVIMGVRIEITSEDDINIINDINVNTVSSLPQSDWEETNTSDGSYILNKPAIRAGDGEGSIVEGINTLSNDAAIYTIYVSKEYGNNDTFTYTTEDTLPSATNLKNYGIWYDSTQTQGYLSILNIDTTNQTITVSSTYALAAVSDREIKIYYKYSFAKGKNSHTEGSNTIAIGVNSHAEGSGCQAIYGHAEGTNTKSLNIACHAEGFRTIANGIYGHAEGQSTQVNGLASHAEGRNTIANGHVQHVQGKYNIEDASGNDGVYAHIVGNGTEENARSNAHTLDWNGNAWYAGKVSAGTVANPANPTAANDLATKAYVDANASGSTPDWNENDTTSSSYIQNRTHYKMSLGYIYPVTISLYEASEETLEFNGETYPYSLGFSSYETEELSVQDIFPTGTMADIDVSITSSTAVVNGESILLTNMYDENLDVLYSYNTDYALYIHTPWITLYSKTNTLPTSFIYNLKTTNEIFTYVKLDNKYLNGELIISGDGRNSEIFNGITYDEHNTPSKIATGDFSHIEGGDGTQIISIILSGNAGATEYSVSNFYYNNYFDFIYGMELYSDYGSTATGSTITAFNTDIKNGIGTITLSKSLDENNDIISTEYYLYLPGQASIGHSSHVEGFETMAYGEYSHAEGHGTLAYGNCSHSEGLNTRAIGHWSFARGSSSIANANHSFANGVEVVTDGFNSYAEGQRTYALGNYSHVEGQYYDNSSLVLFLTGDANVYTYTVVSDTNSLGLPRDYFIGACYSETNSRIIKITKTNGLITTIKVDKTLSDTAIENQRFVFRFGGVAAGNTSHVEGKGCVASGDVSHAEGWYTLSAGNRSHSEGWGTLAYGTNQHVQGKYNIGDTSNTYAHIVGNGDSTTRSNAHTLDWSGNAWYAGKVSAGTVANPANPTAANDLATKAYVDDATASITDEKVSTGTIGNDIYYPIVGTNTSSATTKYIDSTGFKYDATSSTNGYARLYLGNGTASGTEGSKYGRLMIYGTTAYGVTLDSGSPTENRTISLPNKNGTIALTSDVPTKVSDLTNDSGFITSYTETDPIFVASVAHGITSSDISNWNNKTSLTLGTTSSTAFRGDYGQSAYTHAVTNKGSAFTSDLYKITTNSEGHVTGAVAVQKSDITGLGIPAQDTTYTFDGTYNASTNKAATVSTVTNAVSGKANTSDVLTKTNTTSYTPTANYHPATKKYVDDSISGFSTDLSGLSDTSITTPSDGQLLKYNATSGKWENVTLSLAINNNVIQLKEGNTVISSVTLPVYKGGVSS